MAEVQGEAVCTAPPELTWTFVRDFENWIAELEGYESHEVTDGGSLSLRLRGRVGPITKVTRLRVVITHEQAPSRIAFSLTGLTDPLEGDGELDVTAAGHRHSRVAYRLRLRGRGIAAPVLDEFLEGMLPRAIGDLAGGISERLGKVADS